MASSGGVHLGMDLVDQAICQVAFLKAVSGNKELCKPEVLNHALYRYENLWLPLAAEHPGEYLCAPMDIEWVWHCHMLSPDAYEKDCNSIVRMTINHTILRPDDFQRFRDKAHEYWTEKYTEPFYLDYSAPLDDETLSNFPSNISDDILNNVERQKVFLYQVSLPHYLDRKFLEGALSRYKKFLHLKKQYPEEVLIPSNDVELIWRTHQLNPIIYKNDTMRVVGQSFNSDNYEREEEHGGANLTAADKRTHTLWKQVHNEPLSRYGTMFRGTPPYDTMYALTAEDELTFSTKLCVISFDHVNLHIPSPDLNRSKNVILKASSAKVSRQEVVKWYTLKRPANSKPGSPLITWTKIGSFNFDTGSEHGILFSIQQKSGIMGTKTEVDSKFLDLMPLIESPSTAMKPGSLLKGRLGFKGNTTLDVLGHFQQPNTGEVHLHLEEGPYKDDVIPEDVQTLLGPIGFERLPAGTDNLCKVAIHKLKNHIGHLAFQVRTIHSTSLLTSVVQVLYKDQICAMAHLIGGDQLPLPTQVGDDVLTLNPRKGERAVVIKNNNGDWGVVCGHWTGFRKGFPPTEGREGIPGSFGTLAIKFYKTSSGEVHQIELGYGQRQYAVSIDSTRVDLKGGYIRINPQSNEVAENISLVFAISLLHVLCVPRPTVRKEGYQVAVSINEGDRSVGSVPSDTMICVRAAGLLTNTPSNVFIAGRFGKRFCVLYPGSNEEHDTHPDIESEWDNLSGLDFDDTGYANDGYDGSGDDASVGTGYVEDRRGGSGRDTDGGIRGIDRDNESVTRGSGRVSEGSRSGSRHDSEYGRGGSGRDSESCKEGSGRDSESGIDGSGRDSGCDRDLDGLYGGADGGAGDDETASCDSFGESESYDTRL